MVQKERKLYVAVNEQDTHKIEGFIEEICDDFNIFNAYFGNIMMAVMEACETSFVIMNDKNEEHIQLDFWSEKNKLVFKIKGLKDVYVKKVNYKELDINDNLSEDSSKSSMIIKMLSDEVVVDENDNSLKLVFYISSINYNTSLLREKSVNEYFEKIQRSIKAHE